MPSKCSELLASKWEAPPPMLSTAAGVLRRSARLPTAHLGAWVPPSLVSSSPLCTTTPITEPSGHASDPVKTAAGSGPPPIRVSLTESAGRGVFATRPIGAGDLIHTASPVVAHPSSSLLHEVCYNCLRRRGGGGVSALAGSRDDVHYLCSEKCREQSKGFLEVESRPNWAAYDTHCRERELKYPFLVKRLACMVISGAASADCLDILQPDNMYGDVMSEMKEEFELLKLAFVEARVEDACIGFLTKCWYFGVLARIRINAFRIETIGRSYEDLLASASSTLSADSAVGNAVYMLPSFYNHDCDPNVHIIWIDNADAKLKALRNIEADEELRICYIDASMDREARRSLLSKGFGFQCNCSRCLSGD